MTIGHLIPTEDWLAAIVIVNPLSERIPESNEHRWPFLSYADIDPAHDIGSYHSPEPYAGVELESIRGYIEDAFHDGSQVDERGQFPVGVHIEN